MWVVNNPCINSFYKVISLCTLWIKSLHWSCIDVMFVIHAKSHEYSSFTPQIQDIHIKKIAWSSWLSQSVDRPKLSRLLLLPCCMVIADYHTSSDNSNRQQQPTASYRQTSKSLPGVSDINEKELSRHVSHKICSNPSEFYDYYLVYYLLIILWDNICSW